MRIAISQRVERVAAYGEQRDCLDQQWYRLLEALGFTPLAVPNTLQDVAGWLGELNVQGVILSGGNDLAQLPGADNTAPTRDATEAQLLSYARQQELPLLGVCRGLQMLNVWLGGELSPVSGHAGTRHALQPAAEDPLLAPFKEVNSYHNWGIAPAGLAAALTAQLRGGDGYIEAVRHAQLPWLGIMWHPEREQPFCRHDLTLIDALFNQ